MVLEEVHPLAFGLEGRREVLVWRCSHKGCERYFYGTVGYQDRNPAAAAVTLSPRCPKDGAFLVVQQATRRFICPVAGCDKAETWNVSDSPGEEHGEYAEHAGVGAR